MKVILTRRQTLMTIQALEWAKSPDLSANNPINSPWQRIIDKLRKGLK